MATSFELAIDNLGAPFGVVPNTAYPYLTPVCILDNVGNPASPDNFITVGALATPNNPDPWTLTFLWQTVGTNITGFYTLDAFLDEVGPVIPPGGPPPPDRRVPGFPHPLVGGAPGQFAVTVNVPASNGSGIGSNVRSGLYKLYTVIRYTEGTGPNAAVRLAGRGEGPLIEFFQPE